MGQYLNFFFPVPVRHRDAGSVFEWWEARRGTYNLIVGAAGCFTLAAFTLLTSIPGFFGGEGPPLPGLLVVAAVYGVIANFCYLLGPLTELVMIRLWGDEAPRAGPLLYRQGLIFSVGLTLMPVAFAGLAFLVQLAQRLLV
jgi:hypothetical protein